MIRPTPRHDRPAGWIILLFCALLSAGCGGGNDGNSAAGTGTTTTTTTTDGNDDGSVAGTGGGGGAGGTNAPDRRGPLTLEGLHAALNAAQEYLEADHFDEAEMILLTVLERAPNEVDAHELYGQLLLKKGIIAREDGEESFARAMLAQADERYRAIISMRPEHPGFHQAAGEVALLVNDQPRARAMFRRAGELAPHAAKHPLYEAQVLLMMGEREEARRLIERVITLDFNEAFAFATLAAIDLEEGAFEAALEAITEARHIQPRELGFRVIEAKIHRIAGRPQLALEMLMAVHGTAKDDPGVVTEIAACHTALGQHRAAADLWAAHLRAHPRDWRSAIRAGEAFLRADESIIAVSYLHLARLIAPDADEVKAFERLIEEHERARDRENGIENDLSDGK